MSKKVAKSHLDASKHNHKLYSITHEKVAYDPEFQLGAGGWV